MAGLFYPFRNAFLTIPIVKSQTGWKKGTSKIEKQKLQIDIEMGRCYVQQVFVSHNGYVQFLFSTELEQKSLSP